MKFKFNLQLFAKDFAEAFAESIGTSVESVEVAEPQVADNIEHSEQSESVESDKVDEPNESTETVTESDEKPKRDLEKDSAFAKLRREKEALEKAQAERDKWYAEQFKDYGITSEAEYRKAMMEQKQSELVEQATEGNVEAIEELADLKAQEKAETVLQNEKLKLQLQSEVMELNKEFDLKLTSYEEIQSVDNGTAVIAIMQTKKPNGEYYSAVEAYKMANYDKLLAKEVAKTKQQVKNEMNGFNHAKVDSKAGGEVQDLTLDSDTMAEFEKWGMKPNMDFLKKVIK